MGWERVSFFKVNQGQGQSGIKDAFGRPSWLGCMEHEVTACSAGVGLFDASSMVVFNVQVTRKPKAGADPGGARGPRPPLTTKNEAPAPKFYKTEAPEWQF